MAQVVALAVIRRRRGGEVFDGVGWSGMTVEGAVCGTVGAAR